MRKPRPLVLIILDGWGVADAGPANAIKAAKTPNFDHWLKEYPYTELETSGKAVGLPAGQMGNSEVGHLNIGAGRIVPQEFTRITDSIEDGSFYRNPILIQAIDSAKRQHSNVHLMGLLSDGGVHSHITHLFALLELCKKQRVNPWLHLFHDGRDVPPQSAKEYNKELLEFIKKEGIGRIATNIGRYYAMDRDKRWERVKKAYDDLVYGQGVPSEGPDEAVDQSYEKGVVDEFIEPSFIKNIDYPGIKDNDSVIFFNFRPDRAREITRAFIDPDFDSFDRGAHPPHAFFVSLTQYDETFDIPVAFPPVRPTNILADVLAQNGLRQLRIAETEKYAHVTFFFNGGEEVERPLEERILIPSPKVATYDLKPEMSANEVTEELLKQLKADKFDVVILNFANADMVGHTGIFKAAVAAIETIDKDLGKIIETVRAKGGLAIISADHGNADKMMDIDTNKPFTAHTNSKAPFLLITPSPLGKEGQAERIKLRQNGILADIAPTILDILGIKKPKEMTGQSLIE